MSRGRTAGVSARRGSPGALQTSRGFLLCSLARIPVLLPAVLITCRGGRRHVFAPWKAEGVVCLVKGARLAGWGSRPGLQSPGSAAEERSAKALREGKGT